MGGKNLHLKKGGAPRPGENTTEYPIKIYCAVETFSCIDGLTGLKMQND
jgi:hypothetical protein